MSFDFIQGVCIVEKKSTRAGIMEMSIFKDWVEKDHLMKKVERNCQR